MLRRVLPLITGLVLVACSTAETPTSTPLAAASVAATSEVTPEPTPTPEPTEEPTPTPIPTVTKEFSWAHPFSMAVPDNWTRWEGLGATTLVIEASVDRWLQFTVVMPDGAETWLERIQSTPNITAGEPVPIDIDGATGVTLDMDISDQAPECAGEGGRCFRLIPSGAAIWVMLENRPNRAWIIDVDGTEVLILTDAPARAFDAWVADVEAALETLTWTP